MHTFVCSCLRIAGLHITRPSGMVINPIDALALRPLCTSSGTILQGVGVEAVARPLHVAIDPVQVALEAECSAALRLVRQTVDAWARLADRIRSWG